MNSFTLPGIPGEFNWHNPPAQWNAGPGASLRIVAGKFTDLFFNPDGSSHKDDIPIATFWPRDENYLLSAKVKVQFQSKYDAGALLLRAGTGTWGKLCFEYSPQNQPMVVSVVTRGASDDCNGVVIDGDEVFLRLAKTPKTVAFHYSTDGHYWQFVRYFSLGVSDSCSAGLCAQSPTGAGCAVMFSDISYRAGVIEDLRSGE